MMIYFMSTWLLAVALKNLRYTLCRSMYWFSFQLAIIVDRQNPHFLLRYALLGNSLGFKNRDTQQLLNFAHQTFFLLLVWIIQISILHPSECSRAPLCIISLRYKLPFQISIFVLSVPSGVLLVNDNHDYWLLYYFIEEVYYVSLQRSNPGTIYHE